VVEKEEKEIVLLRNEKTGGMSYNRSFI